MIKASKSSSSKAKSTRSVEARIAQLEGLHKSRDEILVVWRLPGAPVSKALRNVDYGPGDRVVCFEWFGSGAPPQPQWRSDLRHWQSKEESDSIDIMIQRILDGKPERPRAVAGVSGEASGIAELHLVMSNPAFAMAGVDRWRLVDRGEGSPGEQQLADEFGQSKRRDFDAVCPRGDP